MAGGGMTTAGSTNLSPEERERKLIQATEQFMRGKLSAAEFRRQRDQYGVDYRAALSTLAEIRRRSGSR
jgi:hypothetical protein